MATQAEKLAALRRAQSPMADVLSHIQYVKGDPGEPGKHGKTPTDQELLALIRPLIPKPIPGADGKTPTESEILALIKPLIPKPIHGSDGVSPTKKELLDLIKPLIPQPIQPPTPQTIIDAVLLELKSGLLQPEHIEGLGENIKSLQELIKFLKAGGFRGGGSSAGTSTFAGLQEQSSTVPNGTLQTFAFAHTPAIIVWNGAIQFLGSDYTAVGKTITFLTGVPQTGDIILNIYG